MIAPIIYAAYNAAPVDLDSTPREEDRWYRLLAEQQRISGLELRFTGALHPAGINRLAGLADPRWKSIVTDIPLVIAQTNIDPAYGLASADSTGRERALRHVAAMRRDVSDLLERRPGSVIGVELHSAPSTVSGLSSVAAFAESLATVADWDWGDVELLVEHADAVRPGQPYQKGWMALEDELAAIERARLNLGIVINWGRSAIETRNPDAVESQIAKLSASGRLRGLMFSGVATADSVWGGAWCDVHYPAAEVAAGSLLSAARVRSAGKASSGLLYTGVKVGRHPGAETLEERLSAGIATLALLP